MIAPTKWHTPHSDACVRNIWHICFVNLFICLGWKWVTLHPKWPQGGKIPSHRLRRSGVIPSESLMSFDGAHDSNQLMDSNMLLLLQQSVTYFWSSSLYIRFNYRILPHPRLITPQTGGTDGTLQVDRSLKGARHYIIHFLLLVWCRLSPRASILTVLMLMTLCILIDSSHRGSLPFTPVFWHSAGSAPPNATLTILMNGWFQHAFCIEGCFPCWVLVALL